MVHLLQWWKWGASTTTSLPQGPEFHWCLTSGCQVLLKISSTSKSICLCFSPVTLPSIRMRWHLRTLTRAAILWFSENAVFVGHSFQSFSMAWKERQGRMLRPMKRIPSTGSLSVSITEVIERDIWLLDHHPWLQRVIGDKQLAVCHSAKGVTQLQETPACPSRWPSRSSSVSFLNGHSFWYF